MMGWDGGWSGLAGWDDMLGLGALAEMEWFGEGWGGLARMGWFAWDRMVCGMNMVTLLSHL